MRVNLHELQRMILLNLSHETVEAMQADLMRNQPYNHAAMDDFLAYVCRRNFAEEATARQLAALEPSREREQNMPRIPINLPEEMLTAIDREQENFRSQFIRTAIVNEFKRRKRPLPKALQEVKMGRPRKEAAADE